ncbi:MAG: diacylglycerol kinase [Fretibacterium sp.]|nr:diacylglycerol kinase [Fretibacterium sp.]
MKRHTPWGRLWKATRYSLNGLWQALRQEQAFEYEAVVFVLLCALSLGLRLPLAQFLILTGCWLAVMALELVNSAVERAFDLIDKSYRTEIKAGKDMLSASVFLMVAFNVILWATLLLRHHLP